MKDRKTIVSAISVPEKVMELIDTQTNNRSKFISDIVNDWFETKKGKNPILLKMRLEEIENQRQKLDEEVKSIRLRLKDVEDVEKKEKETEKIKNNNHAKERENGKVKLFLKMEKLNGIELAFNEFIKTGDVEDDLIDILREKNPENHRIIDYSNLKDFFERVRFENEKEKGRSK